MWSNSFPFAASASRRPSNAVDECVELRQARETDVRRDRVVRGLRHVDVIVRMHGRVRAARAAEDLVGAIREHLVHVHVVRRSGAGLIRIDDELIACAGRRVLRRRPRRSRRRASRRGGQSLLCVSAAAFLIHTCAVTNGKSGVSPLMGKFCFARRVCTPYSASAGTSRGRVDPSQCELRAAMDWFSE